MTYAIDLEVRELTTWFDVERRLLARSSRLTILPQGVAKVSVFPNSFEIKVTDPSLTESIPSILSQWFAPSELQTSADGQIEIVLSLPPSQIPVEVDVVPSPEASIPLLPLWERLVYFPDNTERTFAEPRSFSPEIDMFAFHSFKGGVGRTTALVTFAAAYAKSVKRKLLLVDADIEAPGITYWLPAGSIGSVSFTSLLEALHAAPSSLDDTIEHFALELQKNYFNIDGNEVFVLPSFRNTAELLNARVEPQHLIRTQKSRWILGDCLERIANLLGVGAVFVDLRAGLSELSSPILFDARFKRFLVTTLAEQSLSGMELTLAMLRRARNATPSQAGQYIWHPSVIFSILTEELRAAPGYINARERLEGAYGLIASNDLATNIDSELTYFESHFQPDLLALRSLEAAMLLVRNTKLYEEATEAIRPPPIVNPTSINAHSLDSDAAALEKAASGRIYAEEQVPKGLLTTEALRNLGRAFINEVPNAVLIGAKGSGKTFSFLQIAIARSWPNFLKQLGLQYAASDSPLIVPLLRSQELSNANLRAVIDVYDEVQEALAIAGTKSNLSDISDWIRNKLQSGSTSLPDWIAFWTQTLARAIKSSATSLNDLNEELRKISQKVVFLVDGLEDLAKSVVSDPVQKAAVEAIVDIPNRIRELRDPHIGVLTYVREDFAKAVKIQNFGQFEARYQKFRLNWSPREFLQLVYWLCADAAIIGASAAQVDSMSTVELIEELQKLWGKKLGRDDAAEAYSARWVYAGICDLRGQLQARDVVRFLSLAAAQAPSKRLGVWTDRVIPPAALRAALPLLSEKKVGEAIEEYPVLRAWSEQLKTIDADKKRMPFSAEATGLDSVTRQSLQEIGVIYEDIDKSDAERLYVPEVYRQGLGIGSTAGARPRVQALLQRVLGSLPF